MHTNKDGLEAMWAIFWTIAIIGLLLCFYLVLSAFETPWGWLVTAQSWLTNPAAPVLLILLFCLATGLAIVANRPARIIMQIPLLAAVILMMVDDPARTADNRIVDKLKAQVEQLDNNIAKLSAELAKVRNIKVAREVRTFTLYGKTNKIQNLPFAAANSVCFRSYYHGDAGGGEEFTLAIGKDGMYDFVYKSQQAGYLAEITCIRFGNVN